MNASIQNDIRFFLSAKITAKEVMATAWMIAKQVSKDHNISSKSIFSLCLKAAWKQVVVIVSIKNSYEARQLLAKNKFTYNKESKLWIREVLRTQVAQLINVEIKSAFCKHVDSTLDASYVVSFKK